jgi:hypothetical protein
MRQRRTLRVFTVIAFAGVLVVLAACSKSKMTMANYEKVATGMSQQDVEAILGPGKEQGSTAVAGTSAKVVTWQDGRKLISVTFVDGKVMSKTQFGL